MNVLPGQPEAGPQADPAVPAWGLQAAPGRALADAAAAAASLSAEAAAWRQVDFVSDLHLCEEAPKTAAAFETWLARTDADAIVLLGDVFEVWIGDDTRERPFLRRCLMALRSAAAKRPVCFMAGNRDFLLGPDATADAGLLGLPDPWRVEICGQQLLLSHGDALCLADAPYQAFRHRVRGAAWQRDFLALPIQEREALALRIRAESQGRKATQPDLSAWADADPDESRRWLRLHGATVLLHGHTHRPGVTALGNGLERRVLTDWDFDGGTSRGHVLRLDATGWRRQSPDGTPA